MMLAFSFNSGIFIKTLDNFQTGNNKSSGNSVNDLTTVNTQNAISASVPPSITATYTPFKNDTVNSVIQSAHPYTNNDNLTWTVHKTGAVSITLYFKNISVESCCDYVKVYDKAWSLVTQFHSAHNYYNQAVYVKSDTAYIVLTSDVSVTFYGFYISHETYQMPIPDQSSFYKPSIDGYKLSYSINDASPTTYDLYQNNNLFVQSSYVANQNYAYFFNNLNVNTYNFTLVAFDANGNNASVQKVFQIIPPPVPTFTKLPTSLDLTQSSSAGTVSWTVQDKNATIYKVLINGVEATKGYYSSNEQINYSINSNNILLNNGTNTLTIVAYNVFLGSASAEINVTVFKPYTPIILSTTTTVSRSIVKAQHPSKTSPYPFFASIIALLFSVILIQRKRKRSN